MSRVPLGLFSIRPVGLDDLHVTYTCGTRQLTCQVYLWQISPSDLWDLGFRVTLVDPSPSNMWDLTAYVSRVPVGPFSI